MRIFWWKSANPSPGQSRKSAACIYHKGSYGTLSESYESVLKYIEENGYEIAGAIRESYIDGIWNQEDESGWLTEIQIPVRNRA